MRVPKSTNLMIVGMAVLFAAVILVNPSYARIDPKTIVAIWLFDEPVEDVVEDISGNSHDGKVIGKLDQVEGKFGLALEFPGTTTDYVEVPDHEDLRITDAITLMGWAKADNSGADIVGKDSPGNRDYNIHITNSNNGGRIYLSGTSITGTTDITDGEWHHVAGTWDGSEAKIYVDGVEEASGAFAGPITTSDVPVEIGYRSGVSSPLLFTGAIDEVVIFNEALTEDEIKGIITRGLAKLLAVEYAGKLTTTWGNVKARY